MKKHNSNMEKSVKNQEYTCPMHPQIRRNQPGLCPECGMNLIPAKAKAVKAEKHITVSKKNGHHENKTSDLNKHEGHSLKIFARKFWVSLILTIPVVAYSELPMMIIGWGAPDFPGSGYVQLILASIVFFYGGWVFLAGAVRELRAKLPGMMTLISVAIVAAYLFSLYETFAGGETLYWELTTLITVMLLGHWLEMRAVQGAQGALKELSKLMPDEAEVLRGGKTEIIPLSDLRSGDLVMVKPGGKIPADGTVIEGQSEINESMISGESAPVLKKEGSEVIAGTINGDGSLKIKVGKIGEETFLAGVMRLVAEAQASKSRLQLLSDRAALYLTAIALTTGAITLIAWILAGAGIAFAMERLVAVLVIACPHALGLAVPLVASISTTMAAKQGLLIKQRLALEAAKDVDVVLFDKTGTLTEGRFGVSEIIAQPSVGDEALRLAASVNQESEHPIARAIVFEAKGRKLKLENVSGFKRLPGIGAQAEYAGKTITVGSYRVLEIKKIDLSDEYQNKLKALAGQGKTIIYLLSDNTFLAAFALADVIREESRQAIAALKELGLKVAMITGDSEEVAAWVAKELAIDEYFAKVLPGEKAEKVKLLQKGGQKVAMVGDGVNDAPALTQADLGIAIGAGTNVAIESAGIILVKNDPRDIPKIIRLSQLTYRKMIQNLFWATGYNIVAIPLAAGALAAYGLILQPALSAVLMSASTVIVAINALLLRKSSLK